MLVRLALDTRVFASQDMSDPDGIDACRRLLQALLRAGVYVHPSRDLRSSPLASAIRGIANQELRKLWETALTHGIRHGSGPDGWQGLEVALGKPDLGLLDGRCDLAALAPEAAEALKVPRIPGHRLLDHPRMEASWFRHAPSSSAFERANELAQAPIPKGRRVADLWRERFEHLAAYSRDIVVVDRYCVSSSLEGLQKRNERRSGLRFLLERTDAIGTNARVTVIAGMRDDHKHDLVAHVREMSEAFYTGIKSVELFLLPDWNFGNISHGRRIRFDYSVCEIDTGIDILKDEFVYRHSDFTLKPCSQAHREVERELKASDPEPWKRT